MERDDGRGTVAVLGSSGFIGRHVVAALRADGWGVRSIARSATAAPGVGAVRLDLTAASAEEHAASGSPFLLLAAFGFGLVWGLMFVVTQPVGRRPLARRLGAAGGGVVPARRMTATTARPGRP